jgi:hypothetical protein
VMVSKYPMKPLIEFSIEHWEALLKRADEAKMLLQVAKHYCPDAVPEIEKEIRLAEQFSR